MDEGASVSVADDPLERETEAAAAPAPSRRRGRLILIILLSVALAMALGVLIYGYLQLQEANDLITKQQQQIKDQEDLINQKQTFGAAMQGLMSTVAKFDGVPMGALVDIPTYQALADRAWDRRWYVSDVQLEVTQVKLAQGKLDDLLSAATTEVASNTTGTASESTVDQLGHGFVGSVLEDIGTLCGGEALACVFSDDPYTVHFNTTSNNEPWMTDFIRTAMAYHEFAHVLQFTNPGPTKTAVDAFGGDVETMADCFALSYVDGWSLDQRVYVSGYEYYDVSLGYGYTCNDDQKQVIRDWYEKLPLKEAPISQ